MTTGEPRDGRGPDDRSSGRTDPVRAIRDAIPTSRHARMLFDMLVEMLGERALVETAGGKTQRLLFRRDGSGEGSVVPWPLVRLGVGGRLSVVLPLFGPAEAPPRPGAAPRLRGLGPGEIQIEDGPRTVTVTYGDDGRWMEASVGEDPSALAGVLPYLERKSARPVELLAEYVAELDPLARGPGRVVCPVPLPSVAVAWGRGLSAIREALFQGRIPLDARWAVADGYEGTALAWGATREEARSAWRAENLRARPAPPAPAAEPSQPRVEGEGPVFRIYGASADGTWPDPAPENTPSVEIPLDAAPGGRPRWGTSVRLLGRYGGTICALLRRDPEGFTLVGDLLAGRIELEGIERILDRIEPFDPPEFRAARRERPKSGPEHDCVTLFCRVADERTFQPVTPVCVESSRSHGFPARALDGDAVRLRVVRHRRLK